MKKIFGILSIFLGLELIVSFVVCFFVHIPTSVPTNAVFGYRVLTGIELFIKYFPAVIMTGYVVSLAVHFGRNSEGSMNRFSHNMMKRFRLVMITTISIAVVFTLNAEIFGNLVYNKKLSIINQPKIVREYVKVGTNLFNNGYYDRALGYADAALKLSPNNQAAVALRDKADVEINRSQTKDIRSKLYKSVENAEKVDRVNIDKESLSEVYEYYLKAQDEFDKGNWINAHYYANLGIDIATPKDPNLDNLRQISTDSWNNLSETHEITKTKEQEIFNKKYEGYLALIEHDDLKAYYIFHDLYQSSLEMQKDHDVNFYMNIAEQRIRQRHFFIDETFELESFENANDVYFSYKYADGSVDIIFCKGLTVVEETGNAIQYLRDLTITSIDRFGRLYRTMYVPYAKIIPVSVKSLNSTTKELLQIKDDYEFIPYVILKSIGRDKPNTEINPKYTYANGEVKYTPEYLLLPIDYSDFLMMEHANNIPENIPLTSLYKLAFNAHEFGYPTEVFAQVLMNRLFFPLWVIIIFIILATFAWHNRISPTQYFKMSWVLAFPFFIIASHFFIKANLFVYKLINYAILGRMGVTQALIFTGVLYILCYFVVSLVFLGSRARE